MDNRTGRIYPSYEAAIAAGVPKANAVEMFTEPTDRQLRRNPPSVGRNDPCPCGSRRKFKKCCLKSK